MNLKLETEFSKAPILQEVDDLKRQIDENRPLSPEIEGRVMQKLRLDWNYNSNAIEGNKLSYGETTALLMHGVTAKGKPLKDHMDIQGHNKAVEYLDVMVKDKRDFVEADIRGLHEVILGESYDAPTQTADGQPTTKKIEVGKYKSTANHVQTITGAIHYYATVEETPAKMTDLMDWYVQCIESNIHPVIIAALFHHRFVAIHPFDDGNGRMARILMNLILMRSGYPPVVIRQDDKQNYYSLLSQADAGEDFPFIEYISERLNGSLEIYIKAIDGGDIDEDEDIDKEIALLKMQLNSGVVAKEKKSGSAIKRVFSEVIYPLAIRLSEKSNSFHDFFFANKATIRIEYIAYQAWHVSPFDIVESNFNFNEVNRLLTQDSSKVVLEFIFSEYKNPTNIFTIVVSYIVTFETYFYIFSLNEKQVLSKLYHEELTPNDVSKITKHFLANFRESIDNQLKSPKS